VLTQRPLDLSAIFNLRIRGSDEFEGQSPNYAWDIVYGGLLVAQAQWAATQTVRPESFAHSLHAYFVQGGTLHAPIRYAIKRVRDGGSFQTRRVTAIQSGEVLLSATCSFQNPESGPSWQAPDFPRELPGPEGVEGHWDAGVDRRDAIFEGKPPRVASWLRFPAGFDDDPRLHSCVLTYLSDLNPIDAAVAAHPAPPADGQWSEAHLCVSLDHAIWFHQPARCDAWLLLDSWGRRLVGNRALANGKFYSRAGEHIASVAQEALFRPRGARNSRSVGGEEAT